MADDLDSRLAQLARAPAHPGLVSIEVVVLERIAAGNGDAGLGRLGLAAGFAALAIGFAGGLMPGDRVGEGSATVPFSAASSLAPSALLLGTR